MPKATAKSVGAMPANDGWLSKTNPSKKKAKIRRPPSRRGGPSRIGQSKLLESGKATEASKWNVSPNKKSSPKPDASPVMPLTEASKWNVSPNKKSTSPKPDTSPVMPLTEASKWNVSPKKKSSTSPNPDTSPVMPSRGAREARKWNVSPSKSTSATKNSSPGEEKRVMFSIDREDDVPFKIFSDLVRVGGGLGLRGQLLPVDGDLLDRHFRVELEGTPDALNTYWSYIQIAAVVIGDVADLSWEDVVEPRLAANADEGNFAVYRWDKTSGGDAVAGTEKESESAGTEKESESEGDKAEDHEEVMAWPETETQGLGDDVEEEEGDNSEMESQSILSRHR